MEFKEIGFGMYGFKLGEKVLCEGDEVMVIGFDNKKSADSIIINISSACGVLKESCVPHRIITNKQYLNLVYYWIDELSLTKIPQINNFEIGTRLFIIDAMDGAIGTNNKYATVIEHQNYSHGVDFNCTSFSVQLDNGKKWNVPKSGKYRIKEEIKMKLTKQQFDNLYVGKNLVVHCDTEDKANEFLKLADEFGYVWCTKDSYVNNTQWGNYGQKMYYKIYSGEFGSIDYAKRYTIVSYPQPQPIQDLSKFTKGDLLSGDKVVYRDKIERLILKETETLHSCINGSMCSCLKYYDDDLLYNLDNTNNDIMQVYRNNTLIFQREEKSLQDIKIENLEKEINGLVGELARLKKEV